MDNVAEAVITTAAPVNRDLSRHDPERACNNAIEFELVDPFDKTPLGVFISVVGKDSSAFQGAIRKLSDEITLKNEFARRTNKDPVVLLSGDQVTKTSELLAKATTGWRDAVLGRPVIVIDGEELEFTPATAARIYAAHKWIREQVDAAVSDLSLFLANR